MVVRKGVELGVQFCKVEPLFVTQSPEADSVIHIRAGIGTSEVDNLNDYRSVPSALDEDWKRRPKSIKDGHFVKTASCFPGISPGSQEADYASLQLRDLCKAHLCSMVITPTSSMQQAYFHHRQDQQVSSLAPTDFDGLLLSSLQHLQSSPPLPPQCLVLAQPYDSPPWPL